mmetsp:Transcript_2876/g.7482  ORF Transcript_2876/g.7482 Transcript_2876/m.7482 type:complete len:295 (+) Transcript_2876:1137-2021(+)
MLRPSQPRTRRLTPGPNRASRDTAADQSVLDAAAAARAHALSGQTSLQDHPRRRLRMHAQGRQTRHADVLRHGGAQRPSAGVSTNGGPRASVGVGRGRHGPCPGQHHGPSVPHLPHPSPSNRPADGPTRHLQSRQRRCSGSECRGPPRCQVGGPGRRCATPRDQNRFSSNAGRRPQVAQRGDGGATRRDYRGTDHHRGTARRQRGTCARWETPLSRRCLPAAGPGRVLASHVAGDHGGMDSRDKRGETRHSRDRGSCWCRDHRTDCPGNNKRASGNRDRAKRVTGRQGRNRTAK